MAGSRTNNVFDVVVVGGGHAGAEAAWAACNLLRDRFERSAGGLGRVALVTMDPAKTGAMSCNPAIGGLAKGQMVREIDALGGLMGLAADATGIQFRVLNRSKGPAVRGPRSQNDKYAYAAEVRRLLSTRPNLTHIRGLVDRLLVEEGRCVGVFCRGFEGDHGPACETDACCGEFGDIGEVEKTFTLRSDAVVLTTGTFMRALMHTGPQKAEGGRVGEGSAVGISAELRRLGFELGRLKTGTPPRLAAETIDVSGLAEQPGDDVPVPFSDLTEPDGFPSLEQRVCWMTHTNEASHELIRANLDHAPMYNGDIEADAGPRYCPSIEDKVVRFADRASHHVFLEPESLATNEIYCNGISTSLPPEVQGEIVRALPGCEHATILKHGYAVEYDMVWPHQIDATCMTKRLPGLLLAGQINGTSGYEEAAGQGLVAGVNAVRWSAAVDHALRVSEALRRGDVWDHFDPWRLSREQAYLGVMLDDLVTKTPREPYRMFTSRAEHRLQLRSDNAAWRLTPEGRKLGLVDDTRWGVFERRRRLAEADDRSDVKVAAYLEAQQLYGGYIARQQREIARMAEREHMPLPADADYHAIAGLRSEAAQTLARFRPTTLGQASRLAGVNPADLMLVSIHLRKRGVSAASD
ncbi:MAG: FAD-dependent oxidoreductase [Planctomycetota bacterium]